MERWSDRLTGAPQAPAHQSTMHLAPLIERFMNLRREENAVLRELDQMQDSMPLPIEEYDELRAVLTTSFHMLHGPGHSALHQTIMENHAEYTALLAAMDRLLLEEKRKLEEMYHKGKYTVRESTALRSSSSTSRVLTSSVMEIQRKKHQIKVLLQQM